MTNPPDTQTLFSAMDATWAPRALHNAGPFLLRDGQGGGKRVSAASTAASTIHDADIDTAETGMKALGQTPLFQLRPEDKALDETLARRGYDLIDPVTFYARQTADLAGLEIPKDTLLQGSYALAIMASLWATGGIGPARLAVMDRVAAPKRYLLLRHANQPRGCAFIAASGNMAMIHALEVLPSARRAGLGRAATQFAARWAAKQNAEWLALACLTDNSAACALYESLGFTAISHYHYRQAPSA